MTKTGALALGWVALLSAAAVPADAAEQLKQVPAALDPAKAYVLVKLRNHDEGKIPGNIVLARYDSAGGDVRGGVRSPGSALGKGESVRITLRSKPLVKAESSRLYLVALEPDTWVIEGGRGHRLFTGIEKLHCGRGRGRRSRRDDSARRLPGRQEPLPPDRRQARQDRAARSVRQAVAAGSGDAGYASTRSDRPGPAGFSSGWGEARRLSG